MKYAGVFGGDGCRILAIFSPDLLQIIGNSSEIHRCFIGLCCYWHLMKDDFAGGDPGQHSDAKQKGKHKFVDTLIEAVAEIIRGKGVIE